MGLGRGDVWMREGISESRNLGISEALKLKTQALMKFNTLLFLESMQDSRRTAFRDSEIPGFLLLEIPARKKHGKE